MKKPRILFYQGELKTIGEWSKIRGFSKTLIYKRLMRNWPVEKAISERECSRGERHYSAKLKDYQVIKIVEAHFLGLTFEDLAEKYEVSTNTIRKIINGQSWKHITNILPKNKETST